MTVIPSPGVIYCRLTIIESCDDIPIEANNVKRLVFGFDFWGDHQLLSSEVEVMILDYGIRNFSCQMEFLLEFQDNCK